MGDITVKNLSFSYGGDERLILKDINMEIEAGEFVCILGQSGCGKVHFATAGRLGTTDNRRNPYARCFG